ncbi:hypothetical protein K432DRAFT_205478 [Lepidopterella palustris CBS 459.81]|uniref:Uncharacterized protein n=1 Tax=Lepidopterella palustris CBS 459.81 TaxID=1314670 RepID=A0A8E2EF55_9PEZI|nr:hypothetical protein K432DRAFT_205478 [Lepidopterella palustris CBS 459.81]
MGIRVALTNRKPLLETSSDARRRYIWSCLCVRKLRYHQRSSPNCRSQQRDRAPHFFVIGQPSASGSSFVVESGDHGKFRLPHAGRTGAPLFAWYLSETMVHETPFAGKCQAQLFKAKGMKNTAQASLLQQTSDFLSPIFLVVRKAAAWSCRRICKCSRGLPISPQLWLHTRIMLADITGILHSVLQHTKCSRNLVFGRFFQHHNGRPDAL